MANTTWNPSDKSAAITLTGSNLIATATGINAYVRAVDKQITGKFYWEITATTNTLAATSIGIAAGVANISGGFAAGSCGVAHGGLINVDGNSTGTNIGTIISGTIVCFAFDAAAGLIWIRSGAAGNWNNNVANNPATSVGGIASKLGGGIPALPAFYGASTSEAATANFGDSAFAGAVPAGFTSGFTAGATSSTNALATQTAIEHWATVSSGALQALVTQVALEHWASVDAPGGSGSQTYAMVLA